VQNTNSKILLPVQLLAHFQLTSLQWRMKLFVLPKRCCALTQERRDIEVVPTCPCSQLNPVSPISHLYFSFNNYDNLTCKFNISTRIWEQGKGNTPGVNVLLMNILCCDMMSCRVVSCSVAYCKAGVSNMLPAGRMRPVILFYAPLALLFLLLQMWFGTDFKISVSNAKN
jgi:hypothetical protein